MAKGFFEKLNDMKGEKPNDENCEVKPISKKSKKKKSE